MALQLLYSVWKEDGVEKSFNAASKNLSEEEVKTLAMILKKICINSNI